MFYQYEPIGDENMFEEFCKDLFNCLYQTQSFQLYKTKGTTQHGVDSYSIEHKIVIQSKKKKLIRSDKEVQKELIQDLATSIEQSKTLPFSFNEFILATTTKKYGAVEDYTIKLSIEKGINIKFLSWEDIEKHITQHKYLRDKYYNHLTQKTDELAKILTYIPRISETESLGRSEELIEFKNLVKSKKNILINGMGGIGKTTFLKLYVQNNISEYDHLIWIDVLNTDDIETVIETSDYLLNAFINNTTLLKNLKHNCVEHLTNEENFLLLLNILANINGHNLMIIDNVPRTILKYTNKLPGFPNWDLIISSRKNIETYFSYELNLLSEGNAINVFHNYYKLPCNNAPIKILLKTIGYHTLTIELLAKTAKRRNISPEQLIIFLEDEGLNITKSAKVITEHDIKKTPTRPFDYLKSIFSISSLTVGEKILLRYFSVLPSEYIDYDTLKILFAIPDDDSVFFDELTNIVETGWIRQIDYKYQMHQVIQEIIREKLPPTEENCKILFSSFINILEISYASNPFKVAKLVVYAEFFINKLNTVTILSSQLYNLLGLRYEDLNDLVRALKYMHYSEEIIENHPDNIEELATSYNNLQSIYKTLGNIDKAFNYQLKAIEIQNRLYDPLHPDLSSSYNNLGLLYQIKGDLDSAFKYLKLATIIAESNLGPNHPLLASVYSNLSITLYNQGKIQSALEYQKKSFKIRREVLDDDHPEMAKAYSILGTMYESTNNLLEAEKLILKSIEIQERIYGKNYYGLASTLNNLAAISLKRKDYQKAEQIQLKAINLELNGLGSTHYELAQSYSTLSVIMHSQKKYIEAIDFANKSLYISNLNFDKDHPLILANELFIELIKSENMKSRNLGRNEICHCGSGKKFKKCCRLK